MDIKSRWKTVSYVVNSVSENLFQGGADAELKKIKLVLTFPGAFVGKTFNNNVKAELTPYNEGENEDKVVIEDDLNLRQL